MLPSVTTCSSTTSAPALRRSVRTLGQEVSRRPRATSASTKFHGPWQIEATGSLVEPAGDRAVRRELPGHSADPPRDPRLRHRPGAGLSMLVCYVLMLASIIVLVLFVHHAGQSLRVAGLI